MADYRFKQTGDEIQEILDTATPQSDLTAETQRAELAEQALQGNIDIEERDRKAADVTLQGNIDNEESRAKAAEKANADDIDTIEEKIPSGASSGNKLVDTNTMNSSIATATATWRGSFNLVSDLHLTVSATESNIIAALASAIGTADNNDYCYVMVPVANDKPTEIARVDRYKFNGTTWSFEYALNNSGFTAAQWEALNSGITSGLVSKLSDLPTIAQLNTLLSGKQDVINDLSTIRSGASAGATAVQPSGLQPITSDIDAIEGKIPAAASDQNQLADKQFVNSSIATNTATFRGTYNLVTNLSLTIAATHEQIAGTLGTVIVTADKNDYAFVQIPVADATPTVIASVERYKHNGDGWAFEYTLNNSGFTAAQWNAINSGILSGDVTKLRALPTNSELNTLLGGKQDVISDLSTIRSNASAGAGAAEALPNTNARVQFIENGLGKYDAVRSITLNQAVSGKYVNTDGQEVSASGYGISSPIELNMGDILLVPSASAVPASVSLFARQVVRTYQKVIGYTYTYQQANPELYATATADYDSSLVYTAVYDTSGETPVLTGWLRNSQVYTTLPATREVTESYYEPLMKQAVSAMPSTGYYVYLCPTSMTVVVSGYTATVSGGVAQVVGFGIFKNIATNFIGAPGQSVLAQAFADLFGLIDGIRANLLNLGECKAICIDSENMPKVCGEPLVIEGAGAPSLVPLFVGQRYHDTTNKKCYEAFAVTNSTSDWTLLN